MSNVLQVFDKGVVDQGLVGALLDRRPSLNLIRALNLLLISSLLDFLFLIF